MTLHIFNPDHDLALAANLAHFTAPRAGRLLHEELGFIPAIWAESGDAIVVNDVEKAYRAWTQLKEECLEAGLPLADSDKDFSFITRKELSALNACLPNLQISPWGWNLSLRTELLRSGMDETTLPSVETLEQYRQWSHRQWAADHLLPELRGLSELTVGESKCLHHFPEMEYGQDETSLLPSSFVLKSPWSSSGRGVRVLRNGIDERTAKWAANIIEQQGGIMLEPYYDRVLDFAMEYYIDSEGTVHYEGLSIFLTDKGAYSGNLLASEKEKADILCGYLPIELLENVRQRLLDLLAKHLKDYRGALGVDMMVVKEDGYRLHPCVELNLRRTMGHVALALTPQQPIADSCVENSEKRLPLAVMRTVVEGQYKLQISRVETDRAYKLFP